MFDVVRWCSIAAAVLGALGSAFAQTAFAQTSAPYPDRPIRLVVAFVPGGATDTMARQILGELQQALGQSVVVENRPGANGLSAGRTSRPRRPTAIRCSWPRTRSPYDAIASVASSPLVLVVANNVRANTVQELIAHSKAAPQKMNYASAGIGSVTHLVFEVFRDGAGIEAVHVPYKGGGQAVADVIAGHIPVTFASTQVAKGLVESRRIKALAVTSTARSPALPDVPTLKEAGVSHADVDLRFWYGLFGPRGIPEAAKARLDRAVATMVSDPKVLERLAKLDIAPDYTPAAALAAKLENEIRNWSAFVDAKNIKPE